MSEKLVVGKLCQRFLTLGHLAGSVDVDGGARGSITKGSGVRRQLIGVPPMMIAVAMASLMKMRGGRRTFLASTSTCRARGPLGSTLHVG